MHREDAEGGEGFEGEVAVAHGVEAVATGAGEAHVFGEQFTVDGVGTACEGAAAEGGDVEAGAGVGEAGVIACEHLVVGEGPVGEEDGLGALEVGVAGEDDVDVLLSEGDESFASIEKFGEAVVDGAARPEAQVGGDLIVAAAACVELFAQLAHAGDEARLDPAMDVFVLAAFGEGGARVGGDFGEKFVEGGEECGEFVFGEHASAMNGASLRDGTFDIFARELVVKRQRVVEFAEERIRSAREASTPEGHGKSFRKTRGKLAVSEHIPEKWDGSLRTGFVIWERLSPSLALGFVV